MMLGSGDNQAARGRVTSPNLSLGGFLLLFVVSRLLYVVLIDPGHMVYDRAQELYRGGIVQELVPDFFLLFGPTLFALILAPLLVFTLALVFWYWTIQRAAGERVAGYFALLFCFSPPPFTAHSITAMGYHSESIFFSALTVLLLFRTLSDEKGSPAFPALLGLTAGVGLWFDYTYGLTLLATLGFWLWHDKGRFWRPRMLWLTLGILVGFSPWIVIDVQTHFGGLVVYDKNMWEHFGLKHLGDGWAHPRQLALYEFFADIASDDPRDLPRRVVNLLYSLLYLGPIVTVGVLHLKTVRSASGGARPLQPTLGGFAILYLVMFALAVQFSDFRSAHYHVPAYPFLFFLTAYSLARCQDAFPNVQKTILIIFLASAVVLGLGTHAVLLSLDQPGKGQAEELARIERSVPAGFEQHFYYRPGGRAVRAGAGASRGVANCAAWREVGDDDTQPSVPLEIAALLRLYEPLQAAGSSPDGRGV